jgi:predicted secreted hydrolase
LAASESQHKWQLALPGYEYKFPRDLASHEQYKTEWWYYAGHLHGDDGTTCGYELTFFRLGMDVQRPVVDTPWAVPNVYMAHFAVTDLPNKRFFHTQKLNRAGYGFAGASQDRFNVWNENWRAASEADRADAPTTLRASSPDYSIELALTPMKPLVIHGENGVSQKAECVGCASHYFSYTRLDTIGSITVGGRRKQVHGISWMDHEFGSNQLTAEQVGWDWFSVQLNDNSELMLYVMRRRDGTIDRHSSGTFVSAAGKATHLKSDAYKIVSLSTWKSPHSQATYPMGWHISVPSLAVELDVTPLAEDQELSSESSSDVTYWEGASGVSGTISGRQAAGEAYVEMTGYGQAFSRKI